MPLKYLNTPRTLPGFAQSGVLSAKFTTYGTWRDTIPDTCGLFVQPTQISGTPEDGGTSQHSAPKICVQPPPAPHADAESGGHGAFGVVPPTQRNGETGGFDAGHPVPGISMQILPLS